MEGGSGHAESLGETAAEEREPTAVAAARR